MVESDQPGLCGYVVSGINEYDRDTSGKTAALPFGTRSRIFPEDVRQLLYGKGRNRYRILFSIKADRVSVLYVRSTAQDDLTAEAWNPGDN